MATTELLTNKQKPQYEVKKSMSMAAIKVIAYIVLVLLSILCLVWFYLLIINATRSHAEINAKFAFLPGKSLISNWKKMNSSSLNFMRGLINSAIIALSSSILTVYFSMMTAFAIHAYRFPGRKFFYVFILAIMMIPTQVTSLGFYNMIVNTFNMKNNYLPLILPSIAAPVTFFYIIQYMRSNLPMSLVEAARIDGAMEVGILNRIVLPLMRPALAVQLIFAFVGSWNNYYMPALLINEPKKRTLPILIYSLRSAAEKDKDLGVQYLSMTIAVLPVIVVYLIFARYIVGGVALGGVKE